MPFTPHNISAIVLYGKKSCNRLLEFLNHWQTILVDHAWDRYLFLCVTAENEDWQFPGEGDITPGTQELLNKQIVRCMHIKLKADQPETWMMPTNFLKDLGFKLSIGKVMVHVLCDDLSAAPPAEAAISLAESAVNSLGKGNVHCLYYLMLRDHLAARKQQKELVLAISKRQPEAIVYLLNDVANDGAHLHKYEIRRAAMCEILVASDGRRHYHPPMVYSLGYTSLNANDQELLSLRRNAIADKLRAHYEEPMTRLEAWNILTMETGQAPHEFNEFTIPSAVTAWVESIAKKFVINPTERELENLRYLSGITTPESAVGLTEACKKFFEVNMTARTEIALRKKVDNHIMNVMNRLRQCINMQGFPLTMLHSMMDALKNIDKNTNQQIFVALPKKKIFQQKEEYLSQCARLVSDQVRMVHVSRAAAKVAACLAAGFKRVEETIEKVQSGDNFAHLLTEHTVLAAEEVNLQGKYPKYSAAIADTLHDGALHLFGKEWLQSAGAIYTEDFKVDAAAIRKLMEQGVNVLHKHMPNGFNTTFMDALHTEFDTDTAMSAFLDHYLFNSKRHMFNCPYITPSTLDDDIMYYVDDDLVRMPWVVAQGDKAIVANNDNIEKLAFVKLNQSLEWLATQWPGENRYFGDHEDRIGGIGGTWIGEGMGGGKAQYAAFVPEAPKATVGPEENPRNIHLVRNGDKFLLCWNWEAGVEAVLVSINGQHAVPMAAGTYILSGGMDVTDSLKYGRNEFELKRKNLAPYGKVSLCGKQYPVKFKFVPSPRSGVQLKLDGRIPPNTSLLLGECTAKDTYCFYPVAVRGLTGAVNYDGLKLMGTYKLMVSPEDKFPLVNPVQDISL